MSERLSNRASLLADSPLHFFFKLLVPSNAESNDASIDQFHRSDSCPSDWDSGITTPQVIILPTILYEDNLSTVSFEYIKPKRSIDRYEPGYLKRQTLNTRAEGLDWKKFLCLQPSSCVAKRWIGSGAPNTAAPEKSQQIVAAFICEIENVGIPAPTVRGHHTALTGASAITQPLSVRFYEVQYLTRDELKLFVAEQHQRAIDRIKSREQSMSNRKLRGVLQRFAYPLCGFNESILAKWTPHVFLCEKYRNNMPLCGAKRSRHLIQSLVTEHYVSAYEDMTAVHVQRQNLTEGLYRRLQQLVGEVVRRLDESLSSDRPTADGSVPCVAAIHLYFVLDAAEQLQISWCPQIQIGRTMGALRPSTGAPFSTNTHCSPFYRPRADALMQLYPPAYYEARHYVDIMKVVRGAVEKKSSLIDPPGSRPLTAIRFTADDVQRFDDLCVMRPPHTKSRRSGTTITKTMKFTVNSEGDAAQPLTVRHTADDADKRSSSPKSLYQLAAENQQKMIRNIRQMRKAPLRSQQNAGRIRKMLSSVLHSRDLAACPEDRTVGAHKLDGSSHEAKKSRNILQFVI